MAKILVIMADGCEEIEALTPVDVLRRAGFAVDTASLSDTKSVQGAHGITFSTDITIDKAQASEYDAIVLPGGAPGYMNIRNSAKAKEIILSFNEQEKLVAAICASPTTLGVFGLLQGKQATCYPGMEEELLGAIYVKEAAVLDGNILTGRGMGTAIDFALAIVSYFEGQPAADALAESIVYRS